MADDDAITRAEARVGTVLKDKWRLDKLLGVGGMAAVYAATHRNQKRVAVKMLRPELSSDPLVRTRFLREGYLANTVGHPGAVAVDDDDVSDDGLAFLVMELLEGETLDVRAAVQGGKLNVEEALGLGDQLLDVLAAAHAKGISHRDIKPDNLFLTQGGALKVLDFGIAHLREGSMPGTAVTRAGSIMGTPAFMAPEQARGRWELVDSLTDLWAAGATLFTLLSGHFVHEADTVNEQLALAMMTPAPSIASVAPHLPPRLVAAIDRAIAYKKTERWPNARAMQEELRAISEDLLQSGAHKGVYFSVPPPSRSALRSSFADLAETNDAKPMATTTNPVAAPVSSGPRRSLYLPSGRRRHVVVAAALAFALSIGATVALRSGKDRAPAAPQVPITSGPRPEPATESLAKEPPANVPSAVEAPLAAPSMVAPELQRTEEELASLRRTQEANPKGGAPGKKILAPRPGRAGVKAPGEVTQARGTGGEPAASVRPPDPKPPLPAPAPPSPLDVLERRR